ncbi:MAG: polysaccharide deacetylase family protein [Rubrivivax sp.]|nr:polysaccharide deacetylase family protein [Rubrivivax sp.]
MKHAGLPATDPQPINLRLERPVLAVVVDTEEEFDWARPFDRQATGTHSIPAQDAAHGVYDEFGVVPTYVMDYPVATCARAISYFRRLLDSARAEVGTHCHPWVTPPHAEAVNAFNSFHGNLPADLEREKILRSTEAVAQAFGEQPKVFKAGRYGLGPNTFETLQALGYEIDCSYVPHTSFAEGSGPNFMGCPDQPFYTDASGALLEVPLTMGFSGLLGRHGPVLSPAAQGRWGKQLRLPGLLSKARLLELARLSPEGFDMATQCRLLTAMVAQGRRVFTMTYHSPSLQPGCTPYVRNEQDLAEFLSRIRGVLKHFSTVLQGQFVSMSQLKQMGDRARDQRANEGVLTGT